MGYGGGPGRLWGASGAWHGAGGLQGTAGGRLGGVLRDLGGPQVVTRTWGSQGPRSDWRGPQVATHIWGSQGCGRWPGVSEDGGRLSRVQQASGGPGGLLDIIVWRGGPLARWVPVSQRQRAVVGRAGLSPVPPPGTALTPLGSHSSWGGGAGRVGDTPHPTSLWCRCTGCGGRRQAHRGPRGRPRQQGPPPQPVPLGIGGPAGDGGCPPPSSGRAAAWGLPGGYPVAGGWGPAPPPVPSGTVPGLRGCHRHRCTAALAPPGMRRTPPRRRPHAAGSMVLAAGGGPRCRAPVCRLY